MRIDKAKPGIVESEAHSDAALVAWGWGGIDDIDVSQDSWIAA